jgi:hypothetical protein
MESFEKIAESDNALAEEILKVAADVVEDMSDDEQFEDFLEDLEEAGYDLEDPDTVAEIESFLENGELPEYTAEKSAEFIADDILKQASGVNEGFETNAAAKAVSNYFDRHGVANLGSSYGMSAVGVGSAISDSADAGIGGGWGRLIGGGNMAANSVNATNKVSGVLGRLYKDNIRTASDPDDQLDYLLSTIEEAAYSEGQAPEEFLQDLGFEYLQEIAKDEVLDEIN